MCRLSANIAQVSGLILGVALLIVDATSASGQGRPMRLDGMTPFTIVVVESLPYGNASAVVLRRTSEPSGDFVVVRAADLSPIKLGSAVRHLVMIRASEGSEPQQDRIYRVSGEARPWIRPNEVAEWIRRLRAAPRTNFLSFGSASMITLYMPNQMADGGSMPGGFDQ
jgi:hypothetical protein